MVQYIIIGFVLCLSIGYAGYRIYQAIRHADDKCYGCKGCAIHDQLLLQQGKGKRKPSCYHKK
ncbi:MULTISPECIES: hypothetical protein [Prevotellaceae]|uniref:hypothetical protein n=1 Tax=Prevotellaceae TaxID=171552 RepID=UPI00041DED0D|nr:hypothetical protein [Prevotella phocaeensis]